MGSYDPFEVFFVYLVLILKVKSSSLSSEQKCKLPASSKASLFFYASLGWFQSHKSWLYPTESNGPGVLEVQYVVRRTFL